MGSAGADLRGMWAVTPGEAWAWVFNQPPSPPHAEIASSSSSRAQAPCQKACVSVGTAALPAPHSLPCSSDTRLFFFPTAEMLMQLCRSRSDGTVRAGDRTPGGLQGNDRRRQSRHGFYVPFPRSPSDQQMLRFAVAGRDYRFPL